MKPGERLDTSRDMAERYGASRPTIQRAISELVRDGFIETKGRGGTFICDQPPHLCRFGVAYAQAPGFPNSLWSKFHEAIHLEVQRVRLDEGRRFVSYFKLIDQSESNPSRIELTEDIRRHRSAGLIMAGPAWVMEHYTRVIDPKLPRVCLGESGDPAVPSIVPSFEGWLRQAIDELVARGRKRIAWIDFNANAVDPLDTTSVDKLMRLTQDAGVTSLPIFYQPASTQSPQGVSQVIRLLLSLPESQRPDGIMVSDDNLVQDAVHGLVQSGLRVGPKETGGQLDVVAHANFPYPIKSPLPLINLGFDVRLMLARAMDVLVEQRAEQTHSEQPHATELNREIILSPVLEQNFDRYNDPLFQQQDIDLSF